MNQVSILSNPLRPQKQQEKHAHKLAHNSILQPYKDYIYDVLRKLGADTFDLLVPETRVLPLIIRPDEQITGIVYGRYKLSVVGSVPLIGRGALVTTDSRVLLVDKKFLFIRSDEIGYNAIRGISYSRVGFAGTVVLHTSIGDVSMRTFNQRCAYSFVQSIDTHIGSQNPRPGCVRPHH